MTQVATVERILDKTHAEISVPRKSACGHDCEECAGCGVTGAAVRAKAINPIDARPGQKVVVESSTSKMMHIIALVYLTPVALFLVCYLLAVAFGAGVAVQYSLAFSFVYFNGNSEAFLILPLQKSIKSSGILV